MEGRGSAKDLGVIPRSMTLQKMAAGYSDYGGSCRPR